MPIARKPKAKAEPKWNKIAINDFVRLKSIHPCMLLKFKHDKTGKQEDLERDEGEKWFCNGGEEHTGFKGGCKGGQETFDFHDGIEGW